MVKDNHVIAAGGVLPALEAIRGRHPGLPVEVEVTTLDQLDDLLALPAPPERILLDNMTRRADGGRRTTYGRAGAARGQRRDHARAGRARSPRPASTSSRSGRSPTRWWSSTSAWTSGLRPSGNGDPVACSPPTSATATPSSACSTATRSPPTGGSPPTSGARPTSGRSCSAGCSASGSATSTASPSARPSRRCCTSGARCSRATSRDVTGVVVEPGVRTGIPVLMDNPREVGTDRIVNALAAAHDSTAAPRSSSTSATATTFDVVNGKGQYVGGAISPGIEISLEALGRRGAQLRKVELRAPAVGDRQEHRRGAPERDGLRRRRRRWRDLSRA